jgi:ribosomal protein L31E
MTPMQINSIDKIWSAVDEVKKDLDRHARAIGIIREANEPIWYRGHSRAVYTLRPSLFRTANGRESEYRLHQVYRVFKPALTGWETLFHMQHSLVPTRLLDLDHRSCDSVVFHCKRRRLRCAVRPYPERVSAQLSTRLMVRSNGVLVEVGDADGERAYFA